MTEASRMSDLAAEAFLVLRRAFFDEAAQPKPFRLRQKRNTQDDPLDERAHKLLSKQMPADTDCIRAPGPLITPDLVIARSQACNGLPRAALAHDATRIIGLEVKKLERSKGGAVARASGLDYNTTPPCGTVRVYDVSGRPLDIRGFYLFVCQEPCVGRRGHYVLSALALCDGNILNVDFDYYLSIVGQRTKEIGLGTYGNGVNRQRPMMIFANPLGMPVLDHAATLIHSREDLGERVGQLRRIGAIHRTGRGGRAHVFHCYRLTDDAPAPAGDGPFVLVDPFPTPSTRSETTQPRGRFHVDIRPSD